VGDFGPAAVEKLKSFAGVKVLEVIDMGLEEILKDYIRGRRQSV